MVKGSVKTCCRLEQTAEWMGCSDEIDPSECGWKVEGDKLVPGMTDKSPAPAAALIKTIH